MVDIEGTDPNGTRDFPLTNFASEISQLSKTIGAWHMNKIKMTSMQAILIAFSALLAFSSALGQISIVQVSNLTSSSATITWTTADSTDGCVNYGLSTALGDTICDTKPNDDVHYVEITGLSVDTAYYFEVVSGGTTDNNGGAYYTFRTAKVGSGIPYVIFGHVRLLDGISPAVGAIVAVRVKSGGQLSGRLSDQADLDGAWSLNLGNLKNPANGTVFSYNTDDSVFIDKQGAAEGRDLDTVVVSGASPQYCGIEPIAVRLGEPEESVPLCHHLAANCPNPFNPVTTIRFELPTCSKVVLRVFDVSGRIVSTLVNRTLDAGQHTAIWNGNGEADGDFSSGVYFYRLEAGDFVATRKMVLLR